MCEQIFFFFFVFFSYIRVKKCNYLLYFIAIGLSRMIGSRMEGHENKRDKVGWNSFEKQGQYL